VPASAPPTLSLPALAAAGFERSADDLTQLGTEILRRKYVFKRQEGFDLAQLRIPRRILEIPSALGPLDEGFLWRTIQLFAEGL
jgi:aldehyde:ferredoxin oxidoreductase